MASMATRYKLIFTTPHPSLEPIKEAIFAVGAGTYPGEKYSRVAFEIPGRGQFLPAATANPHIGKPGVLERTEEMRVEILCVGREVMLKAVEALKSTHPYEVPAYEVYKLEDV